ncbi:MAG: hypothetical protein AB1529_00515, partial [Candidatus Micrarchaeota archaeon]
MPCKRNKAPAMLAAMVLSACISPKLPPPAVRLPDIQNPEPLLRPIRPSETPSGKQATRALISAVIFGDEAEKSEAAKRLEEVTDASVAPVLLDGLRSRHAEAQFHCAIALANTRDARAVPIIIGLVEHNHPYSFDMVVLLGQFGDAMAAPL